MEGDNVAGAIVGEGRYAGRVQMWPPRDYCYGSYAKFLVQLEIEYADDQTNIIAIARPETSGGCQKYLL
jgi:hypothetical protein